MTAGWGPCPCATAGGPAADGDSGLAVCASGDGHAVDVLCLPPGPGLGHQLARALHVVLAGLGRVRIIDYPGHGTPAAARDLADVHRRVANLVTRRTVVVGHSWGADVAASIAAETPCAALVLLAPPPPAAPSTSWTAGGRALLATLRAEPGGGTPYERYLRAHAIPNGLGGDRLRADVLLDGVPVYEEAWRVLRGEQDRRPLAARVRRAAEIGTRVVVVAGRDDPLCPDDVLGPLAADGGARVVRSEGGHYGFVDAPDAVRAAVAGVTGAVTSP